jgi:hypothetical protein
MKSLVSGLLKKKRAASPQGQSPDGGGSEAPSASLTLGALAGVGSMWRTKFGAKGKVKMAGLATLVE